MKGKGAMKVTVERDDLFTAVEKVGQIATREKEDTLPADKYILLAAYADTLRLRGWNGCVGAECGIPSAVIEAGETALPARRLHSLLSRLPSGTVAIEVSAEQEIRIECGGITVSFDAAEVEEEFEFPDFEPPVDGHPFALPRALLKEALGLVEFSMGCDPKRHRLSGLWLGVKDGRLTLVTTDGRRMSIVSRGEGVPNGVDVEGTVLRPVVLELTRLLECGSKQCEMVKVWMGKKSVMFGVDNARLTGPLTEESFPDYNKVVPKNVQRVLVSAGTLTRAIMRAQSMTNEKFRQVRLDVDENIMSVSTATLRVGCSFENIPATYSGTPIKVYFNPDLLLEALGRIATKTVSLLLSSKNGGAAIIQPFDEVPLNDFRHILMGIRS